MAKNTSKQYSVREIRKMLEGRGYQCKRTTGSHAIYSNGEETIALPVVRLNFKVGNKIAMQVARAM